MGIHSYINNGASLSRRLHRQRSDNAIRALCQALAPTVSLSYASVKMMLLTSFRWQVDASAAISRSLGAVSHARPERRRPMWPTAAGLPFPQAARTGSGVVQHGIVTRTVGAHTLASVFAANR